MIKRAFLLFLLSLSLLQAAQYNATVMAIQAKLFPKIALLEQHVKARKSAELKIVIYAIESDYRIAGQFQNKIEAAYPDGILGRKLAVSVETFKEDATLSADAVIVLSHDEETLRKIAQKTKEQQLMSFAYDPYHLRYGLLASIYFGKSTKPYLNRELINEAGFVFDQYFLKLSKFYNR